MKEVLGVVEKDIQKTKKELQERFIRESKEIEEWRKLYLEAEKIKLFAKGLKSGLRKGPEKEYLCKAEKINFEKEIKESLQKESLNFNGLFYSELKILWVKVIESMNLCFVDSVSRNEEYYLLEKIQDAAFDISATIYAKDKRIAN